MVIEKSKKQKTRPGTLFLWVAWRVLLVQMYAKVSKMEQKFTLPNINACIL